MTRYVKKPIQIEAEQFFYDKPTMKGIFYPDKSPDGRTYEGDAFVITAHDQRVYVQNGDWILPEPDGEHFYPVTDAIFKATYDVVRESLDGYDAFSNTTREERAAMAERVGNQAISYTSVAG
jgi:hypothetical protein